MEGQTVSTFWNIPFGEPPVGPLRFAYPKPSSARWTEPRASNTLANGCPTAFGQGEEDCLYVNVYTPRKAIEQNLTLPVMFWIFGGAYVEGDAYFPLLGKQGYDGSLLAGRHDVVVVTSNYRLNTLGFNTWTTGPNGETGTQAMADQRLAMEWTRDNIRSFGGDPEQVTIFGESAGGFSVVYHLVSPPSWPLFKRAIVQSGTTELSWFFQPKMEAESMFKDWAVATGCPADVSSAQLVCLQGKNVSNFTKAPPNMTGMSPSFPLFPVGPVVDGSEYGLLDIPNTLIEAGKHAKVPLLIGANLDEGSIFEPLVATIVPKMHLEAVDQTDVDLALNWTFTAADHARINQVYKVEEYQPIGSFPYQELLARAIRDFAFHCSNRRAATAWHKAGLPAYVYSLDFNLGKIDKLAPFHLGDFHSSDILLVFKTFLWVYELLSPGTNIQGLSDIISCQWTSFAYSGDPNSGDVPNCGTRSTVPTWPQYDERRLFYSLRPTPIVEQLRANNRYPDDEFPCDEKCDLWDTVSYPWRDQHITPPSWVVV